MAENDQGPSLELPSFSLRRRKKAAGPGEVAPEPAASDEEPTQMLPAEPAEDAAPATVTAQPTEPSPPVEPAATAATAAPELAEVAEELPASEVQPATERATKPAKAPKAPKPPKERKPRNRWVGAGLVGLLSGFALVGLINATLRACDAAEGTTSCGGPGIFVLVAILLLITVGASRLLRLWGLEDAGTVAFLGIALTAIIALVFLTARLLSPAMVLVIPAISLVTFLAGGWLAANMTEADEA